MDLDSTCPSGKTRYAKRKQARRAAKTAERTMRMSFVIYSCHDCGGFHLSTTSKALLRKRRALGRRGL